MIATIDMRRDREAEKIISADSIFGAEDLLQLGIQKRIETGQRRGEDALHSLFPNTPVCVLPADFFGGLLEIFQTDKNLRPHTVLRKMQVGRNELMVILRLRQRITIRFPSKALHWKKLLIIAKGIKKQAYLRYENTPAHFIEISYSATYEGSSILGLSKKPISSLILKYKK